MRTGGSKWLTAAPYVIPPNNNHACLETPVRGAEAVGAESWEVQVERV